MKERGAKIAELLTEIWGPDAAEAACKMGLLCIQFWHIESGPEKARWGTGARAFQEAVKILMEESNGNA